MANLVRAIANDGSAVVTALDSTQIVSKMEQIHHTSAVITAALGRLLTAAAMMGSQLKGEEQSLTLRLKVTGPCDTLIAVSDSHGNVKGYPSVPVVELPLNQYGKLDVSGAVGKQGMLYVIKDIGMKEPYIGQIPLVSGEIAEDITSYYAVSEQTPTVCALGVLVAPDLSVLHAGGYLLQLLPGAAERTIVKIEETVKNILSVTQMLSQGNTPKDLCLRLLEGLGPEIMEEQDCSYLCDCTKNRVEKALISLGREELECMIQEGKNTEVCCSFCDRKYCFTPNDLKKLLQNQKNG